MQSFTPAQFPEMEVFFDWEQGQEQTWEEPGFPEEFEFGPVQVNGKSISEELQDHLVEFFTDEWIKEL